MVRQWYYTLCSGTIFTFEDLVGAFISQFSVHKVHKKPSHHLSTIHQREYESTKAYLACFVKEKMLFEDRSDATAQGALLARLCNLTMKYLLSVAKPRLYLALIEEIRKHIDAE